MRQGINQSIAAFLITRPAVAYLGWGWESDDARWPRDNVRRRRGILWCRRRVWKQSAESAGLSLCVSVSLCVSLARSLASLVVVRVQVTGYEPFLLQPGTPTGPCVDEGGGVFSRQWSHGKAVLDCAAWRSSLPFPSL